MSNRSKDENPPLRVEWGWIVQQGISILQQELKKNPRSKKGLMHNEELSKAKRYYRKIFERLGLIADLINKDDFNLGAATFSISPEDKKLWESVRNYSEWEGKVEF